MENKTSKIESIKNSQASKVPGKWFTFIKLEDGTDACFFFSTEVCPLKKGDIIEYTTEGEFNKKRIKLVQKLEQEATKNVPESIKMTSTMDYKVESLKMAVSAFNSGKIEKEKIKDMAKYLLTILSK